MLESQNYLVTREVALRTGSIQYKYRTEDGRFIVDYRTLSRIRLTGDEILNGLKGVESITKDEAKTLIAKGGYKMGDSEEATPIVEETTEEKGDNSTQEQSEQAEQESEQAEQEEQKSESKKKGRK